MAGFIKAQKQNTPVANNNIDPQHAGAWWTDVCNKSINLPKGPARDLSTQSGLSHLYVINDAADGGMSLEAVKDNPDPEKLYAFAQQGRLLLTPTGAPNAAYQVQVKPEDPKQSFLFVVTDKTMEQNFTDPRQGMGYWLMRFFNAITFGGLFSQQLDAIEQEVASANAMTSAVKQSYLSTEQALAEWDDPEHLNNLRKAGRLDKAPSQENTKAAKDPRETAREVRESNRQHMRDLIDFADNIYDMFGMGEYPKTLRNTAVSDRIGLNSYSIEYDAMGEFGIEQLALMSYLTLSDPTLEYYQSSHVADYNTLEGTLSGNELINNRISQLNEGMLGNKHGALDAVYIPCNQASEKINNICNAEKAKVSDFAKPIVNGLIRLQDTLANSTQIDDRFMQAAALAGPVLNMLGDNIELNMAVQANGFTLDKNLFKSADNFWQMQKKSMEAEIQLRDHITSFPDKKVPEELLETTMPVIAEARFQSLNASKNGLTSVLDIYSKYGVSDKICDKIMESGALNGLKNSTGTQIENLLNNNAKLVDLCTRGLNAPEQNIGAHHNNLERTMEEPQNKAPMLN